MEKFIALGLAVIILVIVLVLAWQAAQELARPEPQVIIEVRLNRLPGEAMKLETVQDEVPCVLRTVMEVGQ